MNIYAELDTNPSRRDLLSFGLIVAAGLYYFLMRPVVGKPGQPVRTSASAGRTVG